MANSAVNIAIFKIAVELCTNNRDLKRKILFTEESNVDKQWLLILKKIALLKELWEKLIRAVRFVERRMLMWAEYQERTVDFSREYSIDFLNSSHFTSHGIIDSKKVAKELIKLNSLNAMQRYRLACINCLTDFIPDLYNKQMISAREKIYQQSLFRYKESAIEEFWTHCMTGEIDSVRGEKSLGEYRLEKAIESGSKVAVEYCLENADFTMGDVLVKVALETVRIKSEYIYKLCGIMLNEPIDTDQSKSWLQNNYYADILCLLISKMTKDQYVEFLIKDIEDNSKPAKCAWSYDVNPRRSRVLEYLLDWPYVNYFMKTLNLMWEFLPERSYFDLMRTIVWMIDSMDETKTLLSSEWKMYNYRTLLKEVWIQSPDRYKRYVFKNETSIELLQNTSPRDLKPNMGAELISNLIESSNFTCEDKQIISLILHSASNEEKENLVTSLFEEKGICLKLIVENRSEIIDEILSEVFIELPVEIKKKYLFFISIKQATEILH